MTCNTRLDRWGKKQIRVNNTRAFTLIELLVVIAIISLLVSILLPSLTRAKDLAKQTVCATNLRNLGTGWHFYAQDHDDSFPIGSGWWGDPQYYNKLWVLEIMPYVSDQKPEKPYPDVYYCPFRIDEARDAYDTVTTYHYNTHIGYDKSYQTGELPNLAGTPLLFDYWSQIDPSPMNNYFSSPRFPDTYYLGYHFWFGASDVHGIGSNFLLADGHVDSVPMLDDRYAYRDLYTWDPKNP